MNIAPGAELGGVALIHLRNGLRRLAGRAFDALLLSGTLELPLATVETLMLELRRQGYIEKYGDSQYVLTLKGGALVNASARKPVTRRTARKALEGLLQRAQELNEYSRFLNWVTRIDVFGSYLDLQRDKLGDVDVAVALVRRVVGEEYMRQQAEMVEHDKENGRSFMRFADEVCWADTLSWRFLKARSPVLSITTFDDKVLEVASTQTVYTYTPPSSDLTICLREVGSSLVKAP